MPPRISIVIPVYQNEGSVAETCRAISAVLDPHADEVTHEFVMVNDGSTDRSWEIMKELRQTRPEQFTLVKLTRNFGQIAALLAGYTHAGGDCVVTISADLQDPPELIWQMFCAWREGRKLAVGHRTARNDGWLSDRVSRSSWWLLRRFAVPQIPRGGFDYFLMDRELKNMFLTSPEQHIFLQGRVLFFGYEPFLIPYERLKRTIGKSQFSSMRKLKYFIDGFVAYSFLPLRIVTGIGIFLFLASVIYGVCVFIDVLLHGRGETKGWASLMVVILGLNGAQLLSMGLIGEYLWRTIEEIRRRPHFVTDQVLHARRSQGEGRAGEPDPPA